MKTNVHKKCHEAAAVNLERIMQLKADHQEDWKRIQDAERKYEELQAAHEELLSYLPKVPTQPYEKALAKEIHRLDLELILTRTERDELKTELKQAKKIIIELTECWEVEQMNQSFVQYVLKPDPQQQKGFYESKFLSVLHKANAFIKK